MVNKRRLLQVPQEVTIANRHQHLYKDTTIKYTGQYNYNKYNNYNNNYNNNQNNNNDDNNNNQNNNDNNNNNNNNNNNI